MNLDDDIQSHGDGYQSFVCLLIVPNEAQMVDIARIHGFHLDFNVLELYL